jgi:hypothetical protein
VSDVQPRYQRFITRVLLGFVLISIGYAAGRHTQPPPLAAPAALQARVVVTYMHGTFRCATCNTIEAMTRSLVTREFAAELAAGELEIRELNFQRHEALAARWGISASCVVVSQHAAAKELAFTRLDEVWTLMKDPPAFDRRLSHVIRDYLNPPTTTLP